MIVDRTKQKTLLKHIELLEDRKRELEAELGRVRKSLREWENENEPPWAVGDEVEWVRSNEFGPGIGDKGVIIAFRNEGERPRFHDYQVFYVRPSYAHGGIYTIPIEVKRLRTAEEIKEGITR